MANSGYKFRMLDNLMGSGWMVEPFQLCLWVDQIDRKMFSNGAKWFVNSILILSVGFVWNSFLASSIC